MLAVFQALSSYMWLVATIFLFFVQNLFFFQSRFSLYLKNVSVLPTYALGCVFKISVGYYTIISSQENFLPFFMFSCLHLCLFHLEVLLFTCYFSCLVLYLMYSKFHIFFLFLFFFIFEIFFSTWFSGPLSF